ncbi:MAG: hypothetical protein E6R03_01750 [Hyphomicrobiaceae bacterium]|nr:MAG: hypothetical protein E6R03_01750 [Hyphomicrobiaceae bacterium]
MAKLYRPTYRKCVGGKVVEKQTAKWYAKVKINGKRKAIPLTTDKRASEIMLADMLRQEAMGQVGAVDPFAASARVPLSQHLADWQASLRYEDASEKHVVAAGKVIERFMRFAGVTYQNDANKDGVSSFLARKKAKGDSPRTINWTLATIRAFFAWMVRERRIGANPTDGIPKLDERLDVRRRRRPLSEDEAQRLIDAADRSVRRFRRLSGPERGALYVVAMATGFRANELATLTGDLLDLDAAVPTVALAARSEKNRAGTTQPLPAWCVDRVRHLAGIAGRLFPGTWHERAADMLAADLAEAGIALEVGGRVVDFHSLRHTYVAALRRSGVELGDAMKLARHSDPKLTLAIYGQTDLAGLADAVNQIRLGRGLGHAFGTKANEGERICAIGGGMAHRENAPEDAGILEFSAADQGIPPARLERATCRLEGGCSILRFPAENDNSRDGLPPAWTHSDPRLAALVAAWPTMPEAVRAALHSLAAAVDRRAA